LNEFGLQPPIDVTQDLPYEISPAYVRSKSIKLWLEEHKDEVENWIAIDDMDLTYRGEIDLLKGHFVRTNREQGITKEKAQSIILHFEKLKGKSE